MSEPCADERHIWQMVIVQAFRDANSKLTASSDTRRALEIEDARNWFINADPDFLTVCNLAGFDPDHVQKRALASIGERTGVGRNFRDFQGTGAGSTARYFSKLEFSE